MSQEFYIQQKNHIFEQREKMRLEEEGIVLRKEEIKTINKVAKSTTQLTLLSLLKDLTPYIALLIIILLILGAFRAGKKSPIRKLSAARRKAFAKTKSAWQRFKDWVYLKFTWLIDLVTPGYQTRLLFGMFSSAMGKYNSIPRPQMRSGRCDNHRWIQIDQNNQVVLDKDGEKGKCFSAIRPANIQWELDTSKMSEYYELPKDRQDGLKGRMNVTIPYDTEDSIKDGNTFFVPRCDRAYFGDNPKNVINTPFMMLEDTGTSCRLASHPLSKVKYNSPEGEEISKADAIKKLGSFS